MNTQLFQLTTLSQSSLQDYMDCARRFKLRYLDRLSYPAVETEPTLENEKHQQEGEYFHRLVQQHLIGIPAEQIAKFANTPNLQRWWANFIAAPDLRGLRPWRSISRGNIIRAAWQVSFARKIRFD